MPRHLPAAAHLAAVLVLGTLVAVSAHAQGLVGDARAVGPYRGLFGANNQPESAQQLDATLGAFGGYDDDVTSRQGSSSGGSGDQASSYYAGGGASLRYINNAFRKVTFSAGGNVASSYYFDLGDLLTTSYGANADLGWRMTNRWSMSLRHRFRYSPFFGYSVFGASDLPDVEPPEGAWSDTRVVRRENFTNASSASINRRMSERATLSADASYRQTNFTSEDSGYSDTQRWSAGARYSHRLTEHASARLGYGYSTGSYAAEADSRRGTHLIDAGVDYGRALSFSRNTRFSFGMGTAGYARDNQSPDGGTFEEIRYTVVGDATLVHDIGQSWQAAAYFSRRVRFYDGFADPFLGNVAGATLNGFWGRRVRLMSMVGTHWGEYGSSRNGRDTRTEFFTNSAQFALASHLALQGTYYIYRYRFGQGDAPLPEDFPERATRQGFRIGLSVWVPLFRAGVAR